MKRLFALVVLCGVILVSATDSSACQPVRKAVRGTAHVAAKAAKAVKVVKVAKVPLRAVGRILGG